MAILIRATSALAEGCPIQMVVAVIALTGNAMRGLPLGTGESRKCQQRSSGLKLADITRALPSCSLPTDAPRRTQFYTA